MDINKCNIYFGNLKIKTGYFGQYKFYEDYSGPISYVTVTSGDTTNTYQFTEGLSLTSFGTGIADIRYIAPVYINVTDSNTITLESFGTGTVDLTYIAPAYINITDSNTLSLISFGTGIVNIS